MERKRVSSPARIKTYQEKMSRLQTLQQMTNVVLEGSLVGRASLASQLGQQYGGDRDIYEALGYPGTLSFNDFYPKYKRQDMAQAIINRPVKVTWRGNVLLQETTDDSETELEKAWSELEDELHLKSRFVRVDKLTGIGRYGVLLLGFNDVQTNEQFAAPVVPSDGLKLLYVNPLSENSATVSKLVEDAGDERFGLPLYYKIVLGGTDNVSGAELTVHYSRVVHIIDEPLESEVYGTPRLEVVYNRLLDLEKLVGGSAEMFWRGARPGYQAKVQPDFQITTEVMNDLQDQIDEFEHNLRRILANEGVDFEALQSQVSDPKSHVDIQIQMISAVTEIPKRILTGSERGELSSKQDTDEWNNFVQGRREEHAEPRIIRPFVDRLIELGALPKPAKKYTVLWSDLFAPSELAKVEVGKGRAEALAKYAASPMAESIVPPEAFMQYFLGLDDEQIELITAMAEAVKLEEPVVTPEEVAIIETPQPEIEEE